MADQSQQIHFVVELRAFEIVERQFFVEHAQLRVEHVAFGGELAREPRLLAFVGQLEVVAGFFADRDLAVLQQDQVEKFPDAGEDLVDLALVGVDGLAQILASLHFFGEIGAELEESLGKAQRRTELLVGFAVGKGSAVGIVAGDQVEMRHKARAHDDPPAFDLANGFAGLDKLAVVSHGRLKAEREAECCFSLGSGQDE